MGWGDTAQIQELIAERNRLRKALNQIITDTNDHLAYLLAKEALQAETK